MRVYLSLFFFKWFELEEIIEFLIWVAGPGAGITSVVSKYQNVKKIIFKNNFIYYPVKNAFHDLNATDVDIYNELQLFF